MKIIFLDIDGVLNNDRWANLLHHLYGGNGYGGFFRTKTPKRKDVKWDYYNVGELKHLMNKTGASIVISSTWRFNHDVNAFKYMFQLYGLKPKIIGMTPDNSRQGITDQNVQYGAGFRGGEVNAYLTNHPEITSHVILDDNSDFFPDQPLVQTDPEFGLTEIDRIRAIDILNRGA